MAMADIDVDKLAHEAYIFNRIDTVLETFDLGERIYKSLPLSVRKGIDEDETSEDGISQRIAFLFSQMNPDARNRLRDFFHDIKQLITCLVDGEEISHTYGRDEVLNENDKRLIANTVVFAQSIGPKSVRQLVNFLEATNNDEWGYVIIKAKGRDSEVRHRYAIPEAVADHFDL